MVRCKMAEVWLCFSCCMTSNGGSAKRKQRRKKIDPSMIGEPSNFQHLNHIGSGEPAGDNMQNNMQSKGGYDFKSNVNIERKLCDLQPDTS